LGFHLWFLYKGIGYVHGLSPPTGGSFSASDAHRHLRLHGNDYWAPWLGSAITTPPVRTRTETISVMGNPVLAPPFRQRHLSGDVRHRRLRRGHGVPHLDRNRTAVPIGYSAWCALLIACP